MIEYVGRALGDELCRKTAFVGGCTTALLLTDDYSRENIRHTDDVDLIVHVIGYMDYHKLLAKLRKKGFTEPVMDNDAPICAMQIGSLRVDFMPDDEKILGFTNRWYKEALDTANEMQVAKDVTVRLINPVFFVATKLEAYLGRGNGDPMSSSDIEDLLHLFDGREELVSEIAEARPELKKYIAGEISQLLDNSGFMYAVQSAAEGDQGREKLLYERLEAAG